MSIKNRITIFYKISFIALILIFKTNEVISSFGELTTSYTIYEKCDYTLLKNTWNVCDTLTNMCTIDLELNKNFEGWGVGGYSDKYKSNLPKIKINENKLVSIIYVIRGQARTSRTCTSCCKGKNYEVGYY